MAKSSTTFECTDCGHRLSKWMGRCPSCDSWGTMTAVVNSYAQFSVGQRTKSTKKGQGSQARAPRGGRAADRKAGSAQVAGAPGALAPGARAVDALTDPSELLGHLAGDGGDALRITDIDALTAEHRPSGIGELDRVLGGGIVPGSAVLLAGEPGVGKSTLLLEVAACWARSGHTALIITAEESAGQVRHRAQRTGAVEENLYVASENDLETALGYVDDIRPELIIVDSIQTMNATGVDGVSGGVTQTRAVAATLTTLAKQTGTPVIAVGHVTKDGNVAGPRTIEHLVDVVLSFEGDKHSSLRFLRGIKNRFGATDEVGCFEQTAHGIREVTDPSGLFLHHRSESVTGTAVTVVMDGRRAMVGELQTLALHSELKNAKRYVTGMDNNRVSMILAVLSERCGLRLADKEVYAATVGGMRIQEPSADLATGLALASTARRLPLPLGLVAVGEVGLGGEVRRVPQLTQRLAEAARLGFNSALIPRGCVHDKPQGMEVREVGTLCEAVRLALAEA
ncbi:DNA repair protein RadA [Corynebacterium heidelbergense]|uniref:DNA repair protein RadA n=1 Tax=Corynebacterium heidelbergense TaxID=2055947 RepID=A0A364VEC7_9CORY|nr:DNA repair protein RadA [Corynebacterium heidelbergense]RAV34978.1 DNA repair protein RadA [Corynebacterium heidelbergense]